MFLIFSTRKTKQKTLVQVAVLPPRATVGKVNVTNKGAMCFLRRERDRKGVAFFFSRGAPFRRRRRRQRLSSRFFIPSKPVPTPLSTLPTVRAAYRNVTASLAPLGRKMLGGELA